MCLLQNSHRGITALFKQYGHEFGLQSNINKQI